MAKRIIKETLQNGNIQYRVEKQGLFTKRWSTDTVTVNTSPGCYISCDAIFSTLEEAKIFCDVNPVISREEILYV